MLWDHFPKLILSRILPPNISLDEITHDSKINPSSISVEMVFNRVKEFI